MKNYRKPLSLKLNISWTLLGNIINGACQWGVLILITKLGSTEMLGQFSLGLAISSPVMMFANLDLRLLQATDANTQFSFHHYLHLELIAVISGLLLIVCIASAAGYSLEVFFVIIIVGISKVFQGIRFIFFGLFQKHERMDYVSKSLILSGLPSVFFIGIGIILTDNLIWGLIGFTLTWLCTLIFYDLRNGKKVLTSSKEIQLPKSFLKNGRIKKLAGISIPLGMIAALGSLNVNIPRYFIEYNLGQSELGIFAGMAFISVGGGRLVMSLLQSISPRLSKYYSMNNTRAFMTLLIRLSLAIAGLGLIGILLAVFFGRDLLLIIYSSEFAERAEIFVWIMVFSAIVYANCLLKQILVIFRLINVQLILRLISILTLLIACYALIPPKGLLGAALAVILASSVEFSGYFIINCVVLLRHAKYQNS